MLIAYPLSIQAMSVQQFEHTEHITLHDMLHCHQLCCPITSSSYAILLDTFCANTVSSLPSFSENFQQYTDISYATILKSVLQLVVMKIIEY